MKELVAIQKEEGRNTELMSRFLVRMIQGMVQSLAYRGWYSHYLTEYFQEEEWMGCNEFGFEHAKLEMSVGHSERIALLAVEFMSLEFVGDG